MSDRADVLVIDDDVSIRWVLERALANAGMEALCVESVRDARRAIADRSFDVVVCDVKLPDGNGLALLKDIRGDQPELPVVVITAHSDLDSTVTAYESGAFEYLPKPFDLGELVTVVNRALGDRTEQAAAPETLSNTLVGRSAPMQEVFRAIGRLARTTVSVLITGESGTGKELVARALHEHSPRRHGAFVAMNTAAIPSELLESELFGHEKGAFTGAHASRAGRFREADGGTLFLDEIGDMPAALQTRLLRVLAEGEFHPVGASRPTRVDVRIVAATHQSLEDKVRRGEFREDLFHRLNVVRIELPPLRDRREDIEPLARHFLADAAREMDVPSKSITDDALRVLREQHWPGNVRELRNLCRRLTATVAADTIEAGDLAPGNEFAVGGVSSGGTDAGLDAWLRERMAAQGPGAGQAILAEIESRLIREAMVRTNGHRQKAAHLLGWGRNTLTRKIRQYDLDL